MTITRITAAPGADHEDTVFVESAENYPDRITVTAHDGSTNAGRIATAYVDKPNVPILALGALVAAGVPAPTVEHGPNGFEVHRAGGGSILWRNWTTTPDDLLETAAGYLQAAITLAAGKPEPDPAEVARAAVPDAAVEALREALYQGDEDREGLTDAEARDLLVPVLAALAAEQAPPVARYKVGDPIRRGDPEPDHDVTWDDADGDRWWYDRSGWCFGGGRYSWTAMQTEWPAVFPGTVTSVGGAERAS